MPIYPAIYDGPPRWYTATRTRKKYVMIHATANTASAENEAAFAKRRDSRVSSHYYVDDDSIVQSLDTDYRAWHAGNDEGNDHAIAYELTARDMNVGRAWWVDLGNIEWPLMVGAIARDCRHHGITPRDLTVAQLRAGDLTGFCMHFEGNDAWGGSDHTDPGPNFPMDHLVRQVRAALEDDVSYEEVWESDQMAAPAGYSESTWRPSSVLRSAHMYARRGYERAAEILAGQAAMLAAVAGQDTAEAAAAAARAAVRAEFATLGPALAEQLADVPAERVETALRNVLGSLDEGGQVPA